MTPQKRLLVCSCVYTLYSVYFVFVCVRACAACMCMCLCVCVVFVRVHVIVYLPMFVCVHVCMCARACVRVFGTYMRAGTLTRLNACLLCACSTGQIRLLSSAPWPACSSQPSAFDLITRAHVQLTHTQLVYLANVLYSLVSSTLVLRSPTNIWCWGTGPRVPGCTGPSPCGTAGVSPRSLSSDGGIKA